LLNSLSTLDVSYKEKFKCVATILNEGFSPSTSRTCDIALGGGTIFD